MECNASQTDSYVCLRCGWPSPCPVLCALHCVTAHMGGDVTTDAVMEPMCQQCLMQTTEPYRVKVIKGQLCRVAVIGMTEALVPR